MRYAYRWRVAGSLDDVVRSLVAAAGRSGFSVVESHDIQAALAAKGFAIRPLRIVELGRAKEGHDPLEDLLLPFRLNVFQDGGDVVIAALRPTLFTEIYPQHGLEATARSLDDEIVNVVDDACASL